MFNRQIKKDQLRVGLLVPLFNLAIILILQMMVRRKIKKVGA